jgi:hypothetical protein
MKTFQEFLEAKGDEAKFVLDEKNWIKGAIKHPGRCTPFPNPDCPKDSPQGRLAQRFKHGDIHRDNEKK